jgi:AraC-like DNA-binding protein
VKLVDAATFRRLNRARDLVHAHADDALTLDDLARAAGLSRFHFLRLFRRAYGTTPAAFVQDVRIARARTMLERGASVTETCLNVGFSSVGSFSALFTKKTGRSPTAYRREVRRLVQIPDRLPLLVMPFCFFAHYTGEQF